MRPSQLLAAVVALSSVSAAWPDVFENLNAVSEVKNVLYARQDDTKSSSQDTKPESTGEAKSSDTPSETQESTKPTATGKDDDAKTTDKASGTAKATNSKSTKTTKIPSGAGAGSISMVTPDVYAGQQYYKIGDWVTLAWNYTSLYVTPSAIDIMASCTENQATYTIAVNQSVEETGKVLWDTGAYQKSAKQSGKQPLLMASYTLYIYEADLSMTATAEAGHLGSYSQFQFGMYEKQSYTPWADFQCANCIKSSGLSAFEQLTLKALLITCGTTIASLLYFASAFGVL